MFNLEFVGGGHWGSIVSIVGRQPNRFVFRRVEALQLTDEEPRRAGAEETVGGCLYNLRPAG